MELQHFSHIHPLVFKEKLSNKEEKVANCSGCGQAVSGSSFSCMACGFYLDKTCTEAPSELGAHPFHPIHNLNLLERRPYTSCYFCNKTSPTIKGEIHEHVFTLFWRQVPFTCDACGTKGDFLSYGCYTCGLIVHEKCISLPCVIKIGRHRHHSLSHTFILGQHEFTTWECKICPNEVNAQHGGYCCSDCNYIVHTNCGKEDSSWYIFDEKEESDIDLEQFNMKSSFSIIRETKLGEDVIATEIKHLSHQHNLVLSDNVKGENFCDGCMLFISSAFYYCSTCNFFLHKSCAESPRKVYVWFMQNQSPYSLIFDRIFFCCICNHQFNSGFGYEYKNDDGSFCLRCALTSDVPTCGGHEHRLTFYDKYEGQCSGCGDKRSYGNACKDCNFIVDDECLMLPNIIRHKCDEHLLKLTYGDQNVYSEHNYCDICEEIRNPELWFYNCAICDTSCHPKCVVGKYSFLKPGVSYKYKHHPHPLTLTQKLYDYPDQCHRCDKPCLDAALECKEEGCNYILHWGCVDEASYDLERLNYNIADED
ncbi:Protein kinase C-like, phorbol ester/diacylglycerol binding protein [Corchorus olitorius]|uniref:Protein kinase C-like, phorbol ester/diacylglycerol binding protein n=1 Tax=Corchorus olitorius TaxID=93759 RepID=A0A1R3HSY4_9ROSI|nr:Protein kinase C-like, phorbol ester/diacylglycerol binding protein [Corchorus olitorius]